MSADVLLNLLNEFMKRDKMRGFYLVCTTHVINSIIQAYECYILYITGH